jgi:tellurite resistance protein
MNTLVPLRKTDSINIQAIGRRLLDIPPNFFSISMGLAGLAGVWRLVGNSYSWPGPVSDVLYLVAAAVYLILTASLIARLVLRPKEVWAALHHPVLGPFNALFPISGMLLSTGLQPYALDFARGMFLVFFLATLLLGGWVTSQWLTHKLAIEQFHPGYFLPTVAGGFVSTDGAARFGLEGLGWLSFGIGVVCWLTLNSIILNRLFFYPSLPAALTPLMAVELAPPVVGGNAYYNLSGGQADFVTYILAGYTLLMLLVQLRLVLVYLKLKFNLGWWTFTFTYAATASYTLRWLKLNQLEWAEGLTYLVLGAISLFIGGVAVHSLVLPWHSLFKAERQVVVADVATKV